VPCPSQTRRKLTCGSLGLGFSRLGYRMALEYPQEYPCYSLGFLGLLQSKYADVKAVQCIIDLVVNRHCPKHMPAMYQPQASMPTQSSTHRNVCHAHHFEGIHDSPSCKQIHQLGATLHAKTLMQSKPVIVVCSRMPTCQVVKKSHRTRFRSTSSSKCLL
jgi:hypothetical protein